MRGQGAWSRRCGRGAGWGCGGGAGSTLWVRHGAS